MPVAAPGQASNGRPFDPIRMFEVACIEQLRAAFASHEVLDWADFFNEERGTQKNQLIFGFQGGTLVEDIYDPLLETSLDEETAVFELQVKVYDVRSHGQALSIVRWAAVRVLHKFKPYNEITPLRLSRYGDPNFNAEEGYWTYGAEFFARLNPLIWELTPYEPAVEADVPVRIDLLNALAEPVDAKFLTIPEMEEN